MSRWSFKKNNLYEVNAKEYRPARLYEYRIPGGSKTVRVAPIVELCVWNTAKCGSRDIDMLVDTGAYISTLTESTANSLGIDCLPGRDEPPTMLKSAGGNPIIGLTRWVIVHLGGVPQEIPAVVPVASLKDLQEGKGGATPLLSSPQFDVLGRKGIFENYLLCFDSHMLYAFRRRGAHDA